MHTVVMSNKWAKFKLKHLVKELEYKSINELVL